MGAAPVVLVAVLAAVVGVLAGLLLAGRRSSGRAEPAPPALALADEPAPAVPAALDAVLPVLRPVGLVVGPDDRVLRATAAAQAVGLVRADLLADPELRRLAREVRVSGDARQVQLRLPRGDGAALLLAVSAVRLPSADGRPLVVLVGEDRTAAVRVDEMRRDFVANVSHELKTPVGAVALLAEALDTASDDPEAVRRFAARVTRESARLSELVAQIIELSRLQDDEPLEAPEPVDVDEVVAEAVDRSRVDALRKGIRVVRGGDVDLRVLGSRSQLVIAVANLVQNAVAYSADGGRVAVGVRERPDVVEIAVTDRGIGIPEHELDRIFERFYRLDPARSRNTGGSGLGLSIVKHVAAAHGGEVAAWSVEGTGSTFTLRLPRYVPDVALPEPPPLVPRPVPAREAP